jgi:hypothetical protein
VLLPANVVADDGEDPPSDLFEGGALLTVFPQCVWRTVPIESVVLDRDTALRPREVDSPQSTVSVDDLVLQEWFRQTAVDLASGMSSRTVTMPRLPAWAFAASIRPL